MKGCEKESPEINAEKYVFDVCSNTDSIGSQEFPEDLDDPGAPEQPDQPEHPYQSQYDEAEVLHDLLERDVDLTIIYNRVM